MVSAKEEPDASLPPAIDGLLRVHKRIVDGLDGEPGGASGGNVTTRLLVAATQGGSLIGRQGATIKSIQETSNSVVRVLGTSKLTLRSELLVGLLIGWWGVRFMPWFWSPPFPIPHSDLWWSSSSRRRPGICLARGQSCGDSRGAQWGSQGGGARRWPIEEISGRPERAPPLRDACRYPSPPSFSRRYMLKKVSIFCGRFPCPVCVRSRILCRPSPGATPRASLLVPAAVRAMAAIPPSCRQGPTTSSTHHPTSRPWTSSLTMASLLMDGKGRQWCRRSPHS